MKNLWAFILDNSLLLVLGAVAALIWANVDYASYEHISHSWLHFFANDIGMVFFFALAAKEVFEATLPGGPLASPRTAATPLLAAVGGMVAPALIYLLLVSTTHHPELRNGWAIPCATDIAFSYLAIIRVFKKTHPAVPFLLLLAIADDALGLLILALFYPSGPVSLVTLAMFLVPAILIAQMLRRRKVESYWPYILVGGGLSWTGLYLGGLHPALALVPIVPLMPSAKCDLGSFEDREPARADTLSQFEHAFAVPVQLVLFLFAFANAGVPFSAVGLVTWAVVAGLLVGKPLGIVMTTWIAERIGFERPAGLDYRSLVVVGATLNAAKMGALLSFVGVPLTVITGIALGVRRKAA